MCIHNVYTHVYTFNVGIHFFHFIETFYKNINLRFAEDFEKLGLTANDASSRIFGAWQELD